SIKTPRSNDLCPTAVNDVFSCFQKTPFDVTNKWLFGIKTVVICTVGFWAPFIVIEYQLTKANQ
ncbi:unnamed protein product, partial [Heligmosomoides polygyrus]|uniref:Cytochrome c oxidase polypeptide VIIc n=1 Tax=Heligmosomoides polygyrus TaxID=6339 RepID=A0A183G1A5_HELPZ